MDILIYHGDFVVTSANSILNINEFHWSYPGYRFEFSGKETGKSSHWILANIFTAELPMYLGESIVINILSAINRFACDSDVIFFYISAKFVEIHPLFKFD